MLLLIKTYKYRLNICHAFFTPAYIIFNWKQNNKYEFFKDNKKKKNGIADGLECGCTRKP